MFNVTVIKLKDIIKYLITLFIIIFVIFWAKRYFFYNPQYQLNNINIGQKVKNFFYNYIVYPINEQMPIISKINKNTEEVNTDELIDENEDDADEEFMTHVLTSMLSMELEVMNADIEPKAKEEEQVIVGAQNEEYDYEEEIVEENDEEIDVATDNVKTEVVTQNPISESYTFEHNGIKIKNETSYELTDEIMDTSNLDIDTSNAIIFHTHTCESYTVSENYNYKATGNFRTTDLNYSIARVGDELGKYLQNYGFNTTHDKTYHDYPAYSGSYTRSLNTVSNLLKSNPADIIIDLHRDAIGSYSSYAPTVKIGEDYCAQLMFVMGTNGGGLYHPNWQTNFKFAIKVQEIANSLYPGLFKPIILRNSRYNQNLGKAACIIEVGATGNTLDQCLNSMKYLSKVFDEAFN